MYSANELSVKFGLHPILCQSLIKSIPKNWRDLLKVEERVPRLEDKSMKEIMMKTKVVRWAYLTFIRKAEVRPTACDKWKNELGLSETYNWENTFNRTYAISDDRKLRWLQFQCIHRFLPTNKRLHMYGLSETNKCRNCSMYQESIAHLFWHCQMLQFSGGK